MLPRYDTNPLNADSAPKRTTEVQLKTHSDFQAPPIVLTDEQLRVLDKIRSGRSVFFTGSAGTGKSVLIHEIVAWCGGPGKRKCAVTASTGIAAVNIGGMTIHSWAGIGLADQSVQRLSGKIIGLDARRNKMGKRFGVNQQGGLREYTVLERWRKCEVLIIDEISMITADVFDKLEELARELRKNNLPFGGMQLVVSGDFCQLPPIGRGGAKPGFAFEARSWRRCLGDPVFLTKVFRQKDQEFIDILNAIRLSRLSPRIVERIRRLARSVSYADGIEPTDLYPTRNGVHAENARRLGLLGGDLHIYKACDAAGHEHDGNGSSRARFAAKVEDGSIAPEEVHLKEGAQVMLIKNLIPGILVNGTRGTVIGFFTIQEAIRAGIRLGTHKMGLGPPGPAKPPPNKLQFSIVSGRAPAEPETEDSAMYPLVRFNVGLKGQLLEMLCVPNQFEIGGPHGGIDGIREQIPIILAWALSIHRSQGQTLDRLRVDLRRTFATGQVYVALSRATSLNTLEVYNFNPSKVQVDRRVAAWLRKHHYLVSAYSEEDEDLWRHFDDIT